MTISCTGFASLSSGLLVRHLEFVDQPLHAGGLFHGIQVLALDVLDQRHGERCVVGHFAHQRRHLVEPGHLRGTPAPLAGDQLVAVSIHRAHQQRLHQALRANRRGELGERLLVHLGARLIASGPDARHRQRQQCFARLFLAAEQRVQSSPEASWLHECSSTSAASAM
jgi:hypothetical protein